MRRRSLHVAAAARPQAQVKCSREGLPETRRLGPRPDTLTTQRGRRQLPTDGDPPRIQPLPVDHAVEAATVQHRPRQRPRSKPTLRWPSTACASLGRQGLTSGRRRAVVDTAGDHAAGHPSPAPACPTATLHHLIPAGHSGRWNAPTADATPDAGRRRPDTGHLDAQTPAPDTGHRSVGQPPVGHRTLAPDTDADRATTAQPASGSPGASWTSDRMLDPSRVPALARPGSCWVAPLARPRLGALLSWNDYGSSVERDGALHPLWQASCSGAASGGDGPVE